jgi:hypothetical protein
MPATPARPYMPLRRICEWAVEQAAPEYDILRVSYMCAKSETFNFTGI